MSYSDKAFSQLVEIARSLSAIQRRFLSALANGAQVLQIYPGHAYSAWREREADGKVVEVCAGLSQNDFRAMRLLMPMITKADNNTWGTEFFYIPSAGRMLVIDALTMSQPIPEGLKFRLEHARRQEEAAASLDGSGDAFEHPRMAA